MIWVGKAVAPTILKQLFDTDRLESIDTTMVN